MLLSFKSVKVLIAGVLKCTYYLASYKSRCLAPKNFLTTLSVKLRLVDQTELTVLAYYFSVGEHLWGRVWRNLAFDEKYVFAHLTYGLKILSARSQNQSVEERLCFFFSRTCETLCKKKEANLMVFMIVNSVQKFMKLSFTEKF